MRGVCASRAGVVRCRRVGSGSARASCTPRCWPLLTIARLRVRVIGVCGAHHARCSSPLVHCATIRNVRREWGMPPRWAQCVVFAGSCSSKLGGAFGPVMLVWFVTIAVMGIAQIIRMPEILGCLSPHYAALFFARNGRTGFFALGAVVLAITGGDCAGGLRARGRKRTPLRARRRDAVRGHGALWDRADPHWLARVRVPLSALELHGAGRGDPRRPGGRVEPLLPHGAGEVHVPSRCARDPGDDHRVTGGHIGG